MPVFDADQTDAEIAKQLKVSIEPADVESWIIIFITSNKAF